MSTMAIDDPTNYIGAAIFWSYIVAALFFSGVVISTISTIPQSKVCDQQKRERDVALFSALACVSFATLSFNMLNVLIQSFRSWSEEHVIGDNLGLLNTIWRWSITSTLFRDFGEAIVANSSRYIWAEAALLATSSVCLYMAYEGTRNLQRKVTCC